MTAAAVALAPERKSEPVQPNEQLIRTICLHVQPMSREAFAPYGELIDARGSVAVDANGEEVSVFAQTVEARPFKFDFLGRHQRSEQVFAPLGGAKSIIAVAPPCVDGGAVPDASRFAAFLVDGKCAFKLHRGTWHASAFPLNGHATFLVLDREGTLEDDLDLRDLKTVLGITVEIQP